MGDDDRKKNAIYFEELPDGSVIPHGPTCAKTKAAIERADPSAVKCGGPAMVNSRAYRDNWTGIFGKKTTVGEA